MRTPDPLPDGVPESMHCRPLGEALVAPAALSKALGVTTKTLARWRAAGHGPPPIKLSRKVIRYRQSDVEAFLVGRLANRPASET